MRTLSTLAVVGLAMLGMAGAANASLIGDSVVAQMSGVLSIVTQFTSPAVVGDGVEFTGSIEGFASNLTADIEVNLTESGFSFGTIRTSGWGGHSGSGALRIDLTDLDWIGGEGEIVGINDLGGFHTVQVLGFGPDSAFVIFNTLEFGQGSYNLHTFSFDVDHDPVTLIPLPATLPLFLSGLAVFGFVARRRRSLAAT